MRALVRRVRRPRLRCYSASLPYFGGKTGLEIGGPSYVFKRGGIFPVYSAAARVDNCTFSPQTIWEGRIEEGDTFRYDDRRPPGRRYIAEASSLGAIATAAYDFVLSSHTLEHLANPLAALTEWKRVLKVGGALALVVPHKEGTFDHRRPVTTLAHLIEDFERGTTEADQTHLEEILRLYDIARSPRGGGLAALKARAERNFELRAMHHHVFDTALVVEVAHWGGLQILAVEPVLPCHIFLVAERVDGAPENGRFRGGEAEYRRGSPFAADRVP